MSAAGADQDLADRDALDVHAEDRAGDALGLVGGAGELHAAGLAPPADEDLGLDHDLLGAGGEEPFGRGPRLLDGVGDLPGGDRQALGDEQRSWRRLPGSSRAAGSGPGRGERERDGTASTASAIHGASRRGGRVLGASLQSGHGPPSHPDPRRRHRTGAGGGNHAASWTRPAIGFEWETVEAGEADDRRARHAAPGSRPRVGQAQQGRPQGTRSPRRSARASGASTSPSARRSGCTPTCARPAR